MVSHYRIKINEIDTPVEMGKSFIFSLIFHLLIIGILLFSPWLLSEKKMSYITSYRVTLVELPKREKAVPTPIQDVVVAPVETVTIPQPAPVIEEPVKPPEPVIAKPAEIKTAPPKKKTKRKRKSPFKRKKREPMPAAKK